MNMSQSACTQRANIAEILKKKTVSATNWSYIYRNYGTIFFLNFSNISVCIATYWCNVQFLISSPPPLDFPGFSQQLQFQKPFLVDKIYSCFFFSFTKWMRLTSVGFWRVLTAPGALRLQLKLKACYRAM